MSTKGELTGFSLPEILQVLGTMNKSGGLKVTGAAGEAEVFFQGGAVVFASTPKDGQPLPSRLLELEMLTPELLAEAVAVCESEPGKKLGDVLVERGALSAEALRQVITEQVQEAVCEILDWPDSDYQFDAGEIPGELNGGTGVPVGDVLTEAKRRQAEWDAIRKFVPSLEHRLDLNSCPGANGSIELALEEWQLICHLKPEMTVAELSHVTHRPALPLCRLLCKLIERGLVHVGKRAAAAEDDGEEEPAREASSRKYIKKPIVADAEAMSMVPVEWLSYYRRLDETATTGTGKKVAARHEKVVAH